VNLEVEQLVDEVDNVAAVEVVDLEVMLDLYKVVLY
jgi:hypothetical protein